MGSIKPLIVIATAEPRGAYHLEPLYEEMAKCNGNFVHLTPYNEIVQGKPWLNVVSDLSILSKANLVVLTGGGFTAWSELVAYRSISLNKPFIISELAYGAVADGEEHPKPNSISCMSRAGAEIFADYHKIDINNILITGTPLLDNLPTWRPVVKRVLLLSSVDAKERDPSGVLKNIALRLRGDGWDVLIRPHPREDKSYWDGFSLDAANSVVSEAARSSLVIGYPGSAHPICAAIGVPVVAVAPTENLLNSLPIQLRSVIPNWITEAEALDLSFFIETDRSLVEYSVGPIGGSAKRMVKYWLSSI